MDFFVPHSIANFTSVEFQSEHVIWNIPANGTGNSGQLFKDDEKNFKEVLLGRGVKLPAIADFDL